MSNIYIYKYIYASITISKKKDTINLKESKEGNVGRFGGQNGKKEML